MQLIVPEVSPNMLKNVEELLVGIKAMVEILKVFRVVLYVFFNS